MCVYRPDTYRLQVSAAFGIQTGPQDTSRRRAIALSYNSACHRVRIWFVGVRSSCDLKPPRRSVQSTQQHSPSAVAGMSFWSLEDLCYLWLMRVERNFVK